MSQRQRDFQVKKMSYTQYGTNVQWYLPKKDTGIVTMWKSTVLKILNNRTEEDANLINDYFAIYKNSRSLNICVPPDQRRLT